MQRVAVVGAPGTGKSTLARSLDLPHVELDSLWWEPGWQPASPAAFRSRVADAVAADRWVIDGFYLHEAMVPLVWPRADVVVWLDLPQSVAVRRALRRSVQRVVRRTELWNGNRQSWTVLTPRSVVRFWRRWPTYAAAIAAVAGPDVVRLRSDAEVAAWRNSLGVGG